MKNFFLLFFLLSLGVAGFIHSRSKNSDCFSPTDVVVDPSLFSLISLPPTPFLPSQEELKVLDQPFHFLGSGHQCFAFESEDERFVLKLIKFHCLNHINPFNSRPAYEREKLERVLRGFSLAELHDKKYCGLAMVHLAPSKGVKIPVTLRDKAGRKHLFDLGNLVFALQEKATPTGVILAKLLDKGNIIEAERKLTALFEMFADEFRLGVYDHDHNIIHNTGFTKGRPIRIDFGKLTLDPKMKDKAHAHRELTLLAHQRILPWIEKHYPEYRERFAATLEKILEKPKLIYTQTP